MSNDSVKSGTSVGILTFLHTLNYGAILQAYALERVLAAAGFEVVQLDYRNPAVDAFEFKRAASLKGHLANLVRLPIIRRKAKAFDEFRREHIPSTAPLSRDGLVEVCDALDYVLVGSDQVWNGLITGFDSTYFLDFIDDPGKKRTYAVSIGQERLPMAQGIDYASLLSDFPCLLVREATAAKALGSLCPERHRDVVLDPTLLLDGNDWLELAAEREMCVRRPYVFVYAVGETKGSVAAAKAIADRKGLEVLVLQQNGFLPIRGVTNLFAASPLDFLSYMANAEAVVTSSFHGTCFSIIFERDFYVSYAKGGEKRNSRMGDLLDACGISGRILDGPVAGARPIDWAAVRGRLGSMKVSSLRLLLNSLGGADAS